LDNYRCRTGRTGNDGGLVVLRMFDGLDVTSVGLVVGLEAARRAETGTRAAEDTEKCIASATRVAAMAAEIVSHGSLDK
jgi:hypothetical protein